MFKIIKKVNRRVINSGRRISALGLNSFLKIHILNLFKIKREISVDINDHVVFIRTQTSDLEVAISCLGNEFEVLSDVLPENYGGLIIDAGGYIGTAAIKLAKMYPQSTVVSLEPSSKNFALLKKNTAKIHNIECLKVALTSKRLGKVKLYNRGTGELGFTIVEIPLDNPDAKFIEETEVVSLKEISERYDNKLIGLLKVDIEGGEKKLFEEVDEVLSNIPVVFVELHDRIVEGCSKAFEKFSADRLIIKSDGEKYLSIKKTSVRLPRRPQS